MAKSLLWLIVILGFLSLVITHSSGDHIGAFPRVMLLSCLGILALCESIEKVEREMEILEDWKERVLLVGGSLRKDRDGKYYGVAYFD